MIREHIQLWRGEQACLIEHVKFVPQNGTIVEIKIADCGTTNLLLEATRKKMFKYRLHLRK